MAIRIVINGFGRIGRTVLRQLLTGPTGHGIEVLAINDIAPIETCAYLFRYDSVFGPYPGDVSGADGCLTIDGRSIPFLGIRDLAETDLTDVDVVLECTGTAGTRDRAEAGLAAGAKAVLISGPSKAADVTIVRGANEDLGDARIVSNASCTTNAIAPLLHRIDRDLGILRAHVTTVHCYTGSQPTVDAPGPSPERSRAAAVSMVPTSTSAAPEIIKVLPEFEGRLSVTAVRVPAISVSAIDAVLQLDRWPDDGVHQYLRRAFGPSEVVSLIDDAVVSTDMRARPDSLVLALPEIREIAGGQLRLFGWYDNEWGFSARLVEVARANGRAVGSGRFRPLRPGRTVFLRHARHVGFGNRPVITHDLQHE